MIRNECESLRQENEELLRETLFDLERSRRRELELRKESEGLLHGLRALSQTTSTEQMFDELLAALGKVLEYQQALVLTMRDGRLVPLTATSNPLLHSHWEAGKLLRRVLDGETVAVFDIAMVPEWISQPAEVRAGVTSALHAPLSTGDSIALLVCTHARRGAFSRRHINVARRFAPLMQQALLNAQARESRMREKELQHQHEMAVRASRLKSQFLSTMSHELRTPLNAILGFSQLMESDPDFPLPAVHADSLQEILKAGQHLLKLVDEVLDIGRIDAGKIKIERSPIVLSDLLQECLTLLQPKAQSLGIELDNQVSVHTPSRVLADPFRLKQVLLNLISNAIKYNRAQGRVWIASRYENDRLQVSVHDTGPGLSSEECSSVFEPFVRVAATRYEVEGTGMGLTIAKRLMELMDGDIGVISRPGKGSEFWISLPLD